MAQNMASGGPVDDRSSQESGVKSEGRSGSEGVAATNIQEMPSLKHGLGLLFRIPSSVST